jgi:hypothetical protein
MTAHAQRSPHHPDDPEDEVLEDATRALNVALCDIEGVFERRGAAFVRSWAGYDWFEVTAIPDAVRRLAALVQQLNAE